MNDETTDWMGIRGRNAAEIVASVRELVDAGDLRARQALPAARQLATQLGVNRNTAVSAYRQLARAGVVVSNRGGGTSVAAPVRIVEEGFAPGTVLRDVSHGNPCRALLPDPSTIRLVPGPPVLYGESTIDERLAQWARTWFQTDQPREFGITVTSGAVDAIEKLLSQALARGDAVALEDPCFLTSINAVRRAGYRPISVGIDEQGMIPDGLRAALEAGARAVVCTPRAHNPTGISMTAQRADGLQEVVADYPNLLVIEDDHFSLLSNHRYHSVIPSAHARWALVRSVSKFLGPDLRLALVASDPTTAERFATQISPGTTWVSHYIQRTVHTMLTDEEVRVQIEAARNHYQTRNDYFIGLLRDRDIRASGADGVNIWIDTGSDSDAEAVATELLRRGWVVRTGDVFALGTDSGGQRLRMTVHELDDASALDLADCLAAAMAAASNAAVGEGPFKGARKHPVTPR